MPVRMSPWPRHEGHSSTNVSRYSILYFHDGVISAALRLGSAVSDNLIRSILCLVPPDCCPILVIRSARRAEARLFVLEATVLRNRHSQQWMQCSIRPANGLWFDEWALSWLTYIGPDSSTLLSSECLSILVPDAFSSGSEADVGKVPMHAEMRPGESTGSNARQDNPQSFAQTTFQSTAFARALCNIQLFDPVFASSHRLPNIAA